MTPERKVSCPACGKPARVEPGWKELLVFCDKEGRQFFAPDESCRNPRPELPASGKWERAEIA
jgi:hypothetical protein